MRYRSCVLGLAILVLVPVGSIRDALAQVMCSTDAECAAAYAGNPVVTWTVPCSFYWGIGMCDPGAVSCSTDTECQVAWPNNGAAFCDLGYAQCNPGLAGPIPTTPTPEMPPGLVAAFLVAAGMVFHCMRRRLKEA